MRVYTQQYSLNQNCNRLEPNRPQHDGPAACAITQQYSSADFFSLRFHSSKGKSDAPFKSFIISFILPFKTYVNVKLLNLKLPKSWGRFCGR